MMAIEKRPIKRTYHIEKMEYHPYVLKKPTGRKRKVLPLRVVKPYPSQHEEPCFKAIKELSQYPKFKHHERNIPYYYDRTQELIGIDKAVNEILQQYKNGDKKPMEPMIRVTPQARQPVHYTVHNITRVKKQNLGDPRPRNMTVFLSEGNVTDFSLAEHREQRIVKTGWKRYVEANYFKETWMVLFVIALLILLFLVWNDDEQQTILLFYAFMITGGCSGVFMLLSFMVGKCKRTGRRKHGTNG